KALEQGQDLEHKGMGYEGMVAEALAIVDFAQAKRIIDKLEGNEKANALRQVAETLIRHKQLADLPTMMEMLNAWPATSGGTDSGFSMTAVKLIPALGPTDPVAALTLARRVNDRYYKSEALAQA